MYETGYRAKRETGKKAVTTRVETRELQNISMTLSNRNNLHDQVFLKNFVLFAQRKMHAGTAI